MIEHDPLLSFQTLLTQTPSNAWRKQQSEVPSLSFNQCFCLCFRTTPLNIATSQQRDRRGPRDRGLWSTHDRIHCSQQLQQLSLETEFKLHLAPEPCE